MTARATIDFEAYSEAGYEWSDALNKWVPPEGGSATNRGLGLVGVVNYTRHPSFEVLCGWYRLPGGELTYWDPSMPPPADLFAYIQAGGIVEAHNHAFEHRVFQALGWPEVPLAQQRCSMAKSRAWALPGSLDLAAATLGTTPKNPDGKKGIQLFSVPRQPTKTNQARRNAPEGEQFQRLIVDYCRDDVVAEESLSAVVPELSPIELEHWQVDQTVNRRGVAVDVPTLYAMRCILRDAHRLYGDRCREITGGISPSEVSQLIIWAAQRGVLLSALDDEAITEALARENLPEPVRQMLHCRQAVASASVKKIHAMINRATTEGRIYDLFNFHAARTGRPTGDAVQPTNFPRGSLAVNKCGCGRYFAASACSWCGAPAAGAPDEWNPDAMHDAIEVAQTGSLALMEHTFGAGRALDALAGCLRGMFVAGEGRDLVSSDYTAIEAVVASCLAGEQWRIDLFRNKGKIYEMSGAKVHRLDVQVLLDYKKQTGKHHAARQDGKTMELACTYGGWINAWKAFDKNPPSDDVIKQNILGWRRESPAIVEFWGGQVRRDRGFKPELYGIEGAFIRAALLPGVPVSFHGLTLLAQKPAFPVRIPAASLSEPCTLQITLLSGRKLTYHNVLLEPQAADRQWAGRYSISYEGFNTNPVMGTRGWTRLRTHGGKLTENLVQAISNDILRYAMAALEKAGYPIVLHVYDEIVCEVPKGFGSVEELESIMKTLPSWAAGWPIGADGGWRGRRYRKG
jgi:DNA polymerase bacteriophage-type